MFHAQYRNSDLDRADFVTQPDIRRVCCLQHGGGDTGIATDQTDYALRVGVVAATFLYQRTHNFRLRGI